MLGRSSVTGLVVAAAMAGCGTGAQEGCSGDIRDTEGVRLTYRAQGSTADLKATADTLCARIQGIVDGRSAVATTGDTITVVVPERTPDALIDFIGTPGRLVLYDWEPVLLDERCRADPRRNALRRSPVVGRERAEKLAARCDARMVRQERAQPSAPELDVWWIVRGEPVIDGDDIVDPAQDLDPETDEPIVTMQFTEEGRQRFEDVTRAVAERGADNAFPGDSPAQAAHHFAIVLDDELVSTPFIDYTENPDGIDGETGVQIGGGFTKESARVLARLLELGPLPAELELVE